MATGAEREHLGALVGKLAAVEREVRRLELLGAHPSKIILKRIEVAEAKRRLADYHASARST